MTMPTTSIRWALAKHLIDTIRNSADATGVLIEPGWPGQQNLRADTVWIDDIGDSTNDIVVMSGGRSIRDDFFTITVLSRVAGRSSLDATMTRLSELAALIEDPVADSATLDDFEGVVSADFVITAQTAGITPEGAIGYAAAEVRVHSRLS